MLGWSERPINRLGSWLRFLSCNPIQYMFSQLQPNLIYSIIMLNMFTFEIKLTTSKSIVDHSLRQVGNYLYSPANQIGLGFVSNVYRGNQKQTNKPVAIKIINISSQDALGRQLLQQEISALDKIKMFNCKHLLLMDTHFTLNDKLYIVTEYCEGKDIAKLLRQHKKFNQAQAQTIMKQILQAYAQVYELGLVHRDLKLSNLLVKEGRIKLADFGFAVQIINCIEQFAYNAGSPYYMPPESLRRNRFTFESDVWALGVIAYELFYGQLPYRQKVDSLQYQKIMSSKIQDIFANKQQPSQIYKTFILECMQQDMQKRATPQFVISYMWPEARSSLDRLFGEEKQVFEIEIPRLRNNLSTQQLRPVLSAASSPISSPSFKQNTLQFTQKNLPKPQQQDFTRGRQQNKTVYLHHQRLSNLGKIHQRSGAQLTERPSIRPFNQQNVRIQSSNSNSVQLNDYFEQQIRKMETIVQSQMNYSTFLHKLILLLAAAPNLPDSIVLCRNFAHKITVIFCELINLLNGAPNRFSNIVLSPQLSITHIYSKMRKEVEFSMLLYQSKLASYKGTLPQSGALVRCIRCLSDNTRSNYKLLFWLCEQFELEQMESQHNAEYFLKHSNINQLSKLDLSKQVEVNQNQLLRLRARVSTICNSLAQ